MKKLLIAAAILVCASQTYASDGIIEISQTDLASPPYVISEAGSYLFTENVAATQPGFNAIQILADHVTLDLNGFSLDGPETGIAIGIYQPPTNKHAVIRNGLVSHFPNDGIQLLGGHNLVQDIRASMNQNGLRLGSYGKAKNCHLMNNAADGIVCEEPGQIEDCTAVGNGDDGFELTGGLILKSVASENAYGLNLYGAAEAKSCTVFSNSSVGIYISGANCRAQNCNVMENGFSLPNGSGIYATDNNCIISDNTVVNGQVGLYIAGTGCQVKNNTVHGNQSNYFFNAGNQLDLLISEIPHVVSGPCKLTLAGNLYSSSTTKPGIKVLADNVTIDLNGFSMTGPGHAIGQDGISAMDANQGLIIQNGHLQNWTYAVAVNGYSTIIRDVSARSNAVGFLTSENASLVGCIAHDNSNTGFYSSNGGYLQNCIANGGSIGFEANYATLENCGAENITNSGFRLTSCQGARLLSSGNGNGFELEDCRLMDCHATGNSRDGFAASSRAGLFSGCKADFNGDNGFSINYGLLDTCEALYNGSNGFHAGFSELTRCRASWNQAQGFYLNKKNTVKDCEASDNVTAGIQTYSTNNIILKSTCSGQGANDYTIIPGNSYGPIVNVHAVGDISGTANANHPWANFKY